MSSLWRFVGRLDRSISSFFSALMDRATDATLDHPKRVAAFLAFIFLGSCAIIPQMRFSEGLESFYDRKHQRQRIFEQVEDEFVHGRWLFITYETDDVFSHESLSQIRTLTNELTAREVENEEDKPVEAVADVLSLTNVKDVESGELSFRNTPLVPETIPADAAALAEIKRRALGNHVIRDNLVGADGRHAGVVVRLHPKLHEKTVSRLVQGVRGLLEETEQRHGGLKFFMTGMPVVEHDTPYTTKLDTVKFTPLMLGIAAVVLFFSVRRIRGVLLVLASVTLASVAALACIPLTGSSYNPLCSVLLPLVTIECVSFALHYLIESGKAIQAYPTEDIRRRVLRDLMKPAMMCWFTTAFGFGSLVVTTTEAIKEFGVIMAASLAVGGLLMPICVAFAWTLAPPESYVSLRGEAIGQRFTGLMSRYLIFLEKKAWFVLFTAFALMGIFAYGATLIRVGESDIGYFKEDAPAHAGALVMQKHLGGSNPIIISIKTAAPADGSDGRMIDPVELKKLDQLAEFLQTKEIGADRVTSAVDYLKVMNRAFLGLGPEGLQLPDTREQVAQLLLINSDRERLREYLNAQTSWVRIVARTAEHDTYELKPIFAEIERYLAEHFPASQGYEANVTGESYIFALNTDHNSETQATGLATSTAWTLLMLMLLFRSWKVGLYAILPNAFPIFVTLGTMGWLGIELSVATSMISSITIGFVVDDTIHFIEHYRERIETHGNVRLAIEEAYQIKGPGAVFTGITFTVGFAVFTLSDLVPLQHFGVLASTAMFIGGIGELTIGPCLLLVTRSTLGARTKHVDEEDILTPAPARQREPTMVDVLRTRADNEPQRKAFGFIVDGDSQEEDISYGKLDERARAVAGTLQDHGLAGERAVLLYPPGLDYIAAVYACFYANVLAVPAYPPDPTRLVRTLPRLRTIVRDADAKVILTTSMIVQMKDAVLEQAPEFASLTWIATDEIEPARAGTWKDRGRRTSDIAFLQYTSGSTADPKGVMLSHGNLLHNLACIRAHARLGPDIVGMSWLPPYHDMGLIGFILEPVFCGGPAIHMSPLHFLEKPVRWLQAISRHRVWVSAAPNFAFDLCVRKVTDEEKSQLDLRPWKMVLNGAEPVRAPTLHRFARAFAQTGFDDTSFRPVYGLAEGALLASFPRVDRSTRIERLAPAALREDRVVRVSEFEPATILVGCGSPVGGQQLVIVDPASSRPLSPGRVGEIWLKGNSVAQGYWRNPEATDATFKARLDLSEYTPLAGRHAPDPGPYLRTGDLGFIEDESLFITGRLKDLIVIRGRNHYPQDIELTVEQCHTALRPGCVAAFGVESDEDARLVIVAELDRRKSQGVDPTTVIETMRRAVSEDHELHAQVVVLVTSNAIPKTSSGKIQRRACRAAFLEGSLETIAQSESGQSQVTIEDRRGVALDRDLLMSLAPAAREAQLAAHLQGLVCAALRLKGDDVALDRPLYTLGLDSMAAVQLKAELEVITGAALPLADYLQGPSIQELARVALSHIDPVHQASLPRPVIDGRLAPGPLGDALVGNLRDFQSDPFSFITNLRRRYGEVVRLRFGPWVCHLITQPEHIEKVLRGSPENFVKAQNYDNQIKLIGKGLITVEGEEWKRQRATAQPSFHGAAIKEFTDTVLDSLLQELVEKLRSKEGEAVDVGFEMKRLTLRAICRSLFGYDITDDLDTVIHALEGAARYGWDDMTAFLQTSLAPDERERRLKRYVDEIDGILNRMIESFIAKGRPSGTLLHGLEKDARERGGESWHQLLRDQMLTFLLAGHDSTAESLTFSFWLLAGHPDVDARLASELQPLGDRPEYNTIHNLPWTTAIVKEAMRLYPPAWFFTRQAVKDDTFSDFLIPAGSLILISPWVTHRDPFLWPEPTAFKPERFLHDKPQDFSYFPFGGGPRSCIGAGLAMAEARMTVARLMREFRCEREDDEPLQLVSHMTLQPRESVRLIVRRRSLTNDAGQSFKRGGGGS